MEITSAKYFRSILSDTDESITAVINVIECSVPLSLGNMDYVEIMRQVDAGELTIEPADE